MSSELCKNCGKPPLASRAGSFTSYLFQQNYCQCAAAKAKQSGRAKTIDASPLCLNCGKSRPIDKRAGSFTSFLFKELRCSCPGASASSLAGSDARAKRSASSGRTQTAYRLAQKRQFTESVKKRKLAASDSAEQTILSNDTVIGGTYRIISQIGMGGMGVVYLVEQTSLHKQFALKVLAPDLVNEQNWLRFKAEAKTMAALNHPSFVNVYDLGIHAGSTPFYAMDYLNGRSLEEILVDEGPLKLKPALNIFIEVLNGLAYAHRNSIVHRDIKPANIMLCTNNGATAIKVLDFGISKLISADASNLQKMTLAGDIFGSPYYMSPEQCSGDTIDARSDIYSIGCSLFEVLTGYVPFEGKNSVDTMLMHEEEVAPLLSDVSPGQNFPLSIEAALATCLAKRPQDRYQSAKELAIDLERIKNGKEIQASSPAFRQMEELGEASNQSYNDDSQSSSKPSRTILLTVIISAIALILGTSMFSIWNRPSKAKVKIQDSEIPAIDMANYHSQLETATKEADQSNNSQPQYFSQLVNGGSTVQFKFPTDQAIGQIGLDNSRRHATVCQGLVNLPANKPLYFFPNIVILSHPELFDSFQPDELYGLTILPSIDRNEHFDLSKAMPYIAKLVGLRALSIEGSQLGNEHVTALNKLANLESLNVNDTELTGRGLAKLNRLKELEKLQCNFLSEHTELLEALQGSLKIQQLALSNLAKPLTESDANLLASCKNIKTLNLDTELASDKVLNIIGRLKKLEFIQLLESSLSKKAIKDFKDSYLPKKIRIAFPQTLNFDKNSSATFYKESPEELLKDAVKP